jgi:hypothetical protein
MQHKITNSIVASESGSSSGTTVSGARFEVGTTGTTIDQTFGVSTNQILPVSWTLAGLKSIILLVDKNVTVKVNSSGSPDATVNLKASSPFLWNRSDAYYAYPFGASASVTNLYLTSTEAFRFQALILS